eukprot:g81651.t1
MPTQNHLVDDAGEEGRWAPVEGFQAMGGSGSTQSSSEDSPLLSNPTKTEPKTTPVQAPPAANAITPIRANEQGLLGFQSPHPARGYKEPSSAAIRKAATKLHSVGSVKKTRRPSSARRASKANPKRSQSSKMVTPKTGERRSASKTQKHNLQSPLADADPKLRKLLAIEMNLT